MKVFPIKKVLLFYDIFALRKNSHLLPFGHFETSSFLSGDPNFVPGDRNFAPGYICFFSLFLFCVLCSGIRRDKKKNNRFFRHQKLKRGKNKYTSKTNNFSTDSIIFSLLFFFFCNVESDFGSLGSLGFPEVPWRFLGISTF